MISATLSIALYANRRRCKDVSGGVESSEEEFHYKQHCDCAREHLRRNFYFDSMTIFQRLREVAVLCGWQSVSS